MKTILYNKSESEIQKLLEKYNITKFRAKQIYEWINRGASDFESMSNLPKDLRTQLSNDFDILPCKIEKQLESSDKETTKFLLKFNDGILIESVLMRAEYGNTVCVSSQAGCNMGCKFCASTLLGLNRNLTADEMFAEAKIASFELLKQNKRLSGIVIMGSGEPMQNFDNVISFMEKVHNPDDLNIGYRHITLSTCGIVPGIEKLTEWGKPINLAISLHAPTDDLRSKIMPVNNAYKISEVMFAAEKFNEKTGRLITYEYILLGGINDSEKQAKELSDLLKNKLALVNLIPWNTVEERDFKSTTKDATKKFQDILLKNGVKATVRYRRGSDIDSACGQLRYKTMTE